MIPDQDLKILFVLNPISGGENKTGFTDLIKEKSIEHLFQYKVFKTSGENDRSSLHKEINSYNPNVVAAVGGDGTVNLTASCLIDHHAMLAIIPCGSANGMAAELKIPSDPSDAIDIIIHGIVNKLDIILVNESFHCIHLGDMGVNARIVKRFEQNNRRGMWGYLRELMRESLLFKHYHFDILCDNVRIRKRAIMVTFANASKYGTGAVINPSGKINDGVFEVCIIKPFPWFYIIPLFFKFFFGNIENSRYIDIYPCRKAKIQTRKKLLLQIDGEIIGKFDKIDISIKEDAMNIIVPEIM